MIFRPVLCFSRSVENGDTYDVFSPLPALHLLMHFTLLFLIFTH